MDPLVDSLLQTWFGDWDDAEPLHDEARGQARFWFAKDPAVDLDLRRRFGSAARLAHDGELDGWLEEPRSTVALVLLLDQIPRNIHRGSPAAYESDAKARETARAAMAAGLDRKMPLVHRYFTYLPFMHSEDLADHDLAERLFTGLVEEADAARGPRSGLYRAALDFEHKHRAIVERFGRFPHRNAVLGRVSTPEELQFLKQPGSGF